MVGTVKNYLRTIYHSHWKKEWIIVYILLLLYIYRFKSEKILKCSYTGVAIHVYIAFEAREIENSTKI